MPSRVLLTCAVSAAILCAQPQLPIRSWADADKIEADLQSRPDDLTLRVQLLRYYTQQGAQYAGRVKLLRRKHVLWMVENHPEHSVLSEWAGALDPSGHELADAEGYTACSAAWQKALAAAKPLFDTFGNAIYFHKTADPVRAYQIAEDGLRDSKTLFPSGRGGPLRADGVQHMLARHVANDFAEAPQCTDGRQRTQDPRRHIVGQGQQRTWTPRDIARCFGLHS